MSAFHRVKMGKGRQSRRESGARSAPVRPQRADRRAEGAKGARCDFSPSFCPSERADGALATVQKVGSSTGA